MPKLMHAVNGHPSGFLARDRTHRGSTAPVHRGEDRPRQHRQHRHPQMRTVLTVATRRLAPYRFQVYVIDPFRQATVRCELRPFHSTQWLDLPQTLAHQVVPKAAHRAQRCIHSRLGTKARTVRHVARDQVGIGEPQCQCAGDALELASPPIQPRLRVCHRLRAHSPGAVLLDIQIHEPVPSPHRRPQPPGPANLRSLALNVTKTNNMTSNMTSLEVTMSP